MCCVFPWVGSVHRSGIVLTHLTASVYQEPANHASSSKDSSRGLCQILYNEPR